eukprot:COSAG02_NODE_22360_length_755_cov_0.923780_2_plen_81_part_01
MSRWMTDNYTLRGFWRGWHCSFNRWLVRYIYVPLGALLSQPETPNRKALSSFVFALCVAGGSGGTADKDTESGGWKQLMWF